MTRPLVAREVELPGLGSFVVYEAEDPGAALDDAIARGLPAPYGAVMWDSAPRVATALGQMPLAGRRVLDLGTGCGLTAIVAASRDATVLAADIDEGALAAVCRAAFEAGLQERIDVTVFDICAAAPLPPAEVVVIADLLYEPMLAAACARRVLEAWQRGSTVVVGDPGRAGRPAFLRLLSDGGLAVAFTDQLLVIPARPLAPRAAPA
jgi:predicted nicotinamide N-methyase